MIERGKVSPRWIYIVIVFDRKVRCIDHWFWLKWDVIYVAEIVPMCVFLQLELEQQKIEEEQENTPEFVKMKSNLRRTKQETDGEERTT